MSVLLLSAGCKDTHDQIKVIMETKKWNEDHCFDYTEFLYLCDMLDIIDEAKFSIVDIVKEAESLLEEIQNTQNKEEKETTSQVKHRTPEFKEAGKGDGLCIGKDGHQASSGANMLKDIKNSPRTVLQKSTPQQSQEHIKT